MGEARRKLLNGHAAPIPTSGLAVPQAKQVKVLTKIRIENRPIEGVIWMILGEEEPEAATGLTPEAARQLGTALLKHAEAIKPESRIIIPGP